MIEVPALSTFAGILIHPSAVDHASVELNVILVDSDSTSSAIGVGDNNQIYNYEKTHSST